MKMTRNTVSALIIFAVALVVFNVVAFALPFVHEALFWVGYGFTLFAIPFSAGAALYAMGREGLKSKFYGLPLLYVAWAYLIAQLVVGFICMAIPVIPLWAALVVSVLLLGAAAIGLVAIDAGREVIEQIDKKVAEKVFYIKSLQVDVEMLAPRATDTTLVKALKELAEAIRYSDPMSSPQLAVLENRLEVKVAQLGEAVGAGDSAGAQALADELSLLLAERNRKCKLLKGV
jgi:hypothetical protein